MKIVFKLLAKLNKILLPSLTKKGLDKVGKQESDFQIKYFKYHG